MNGKINSIPWSPESSGIIVVFNRSFNYLKSRMIPVFASHKILDEIKWKNEETTYFLVFWFSQHILVCTMYSKFNWPTVILVCRKLTFIILSLEIFSLQINYFCMEYYEFYYVDVITWNVQKSCYYQVLYLFTLWEIV